MQYMRLGDLLIASDVINQEQLNHALELQKKSKMRLGDVLIENQIITEKQLIDALQVQLGVEFVDLTKITIPVELAKFVPRNIAKRYTVVPVKLEHDELYVAMSDPLNFVAQEEIKAASHKRVVPMIATRKATEHAIGVLYENEGTARALEEMRRNSSNNTRDILPTSQENQPAADETVAPTIRFVNSVIERAVFEHASDIHFEPQKDGMIVRVRIDGMLHKMFSVPMDLQNSVISRLKIMCGMDIAERKIPQDGRAMLMVKENTIDMRVSSLPTIYGEKVVIRLFDQTNQNFDKKNIGFNEEELEKYERLLKNSSGVILIVGPTGSGKSTTMYTMLKELASEEVNLVTLEDPVEYKLAGLNQCQISEKAGMTFAAGLRSILRQDPDIISVGEIRDGETGSIAMRAAITGHLVLSTLHTNDAVSTINRLADIGVEPYLISSALKGVISQRLVRKICPHCRMSYHPSAQQLRALHMPEDSNVEFFKGKGCPDCFHTGYRGRQAVFEILVVTDALQQQITERANNAEMLQAAKQSGFHTMLEGSRDLILRGITTASEVLRVATSTD